MYVLEKGDFAEIQAAHIEYLQVTCDRVKISTQSPHPKQGQV